MSRESEANHDFDEFKERLKNAWERRKVGLELRHRYELYFVTLNYTLLGLAVQTAKSSPCMAVRILEVSGWLLLLFGGLLSLYILDHLWRREVGVAEVNEENLHGRRNMELMIDVNRVEQKIKKMKKIRDFSFVVGLVSLMFSRGISIFLL